MGGSSTKTAKKAGKAAVGGASSLAQLLTQLQTNDIQGLFLPMTRRATCLEFFQQLPFIALLHLFIDSVRLGVLFADLMFGLDVVDVL